MLQTLGGQTKQLQSSFQQQGGAISKKGSLHKEQNSAQGPARKPQHCPSPCLLRTAYPFLMSPSLASEASNAIAESAIALLAQIAYIGR
eukprot:scaffold156202_cov17-Tisochrysis_lutea.AAC.1